MRLALTPLAVLVLTGCPASSETPKASPGTPTTPAAPASAPASAPSAQRGTSPDTRDQVDPDGVVRRGTSVAHEEAMTVGALLVDAEALHGQTVTVTGTVEQVCAKKGCWMALKGESGAPTIRITSKGYAYFVPRSAAGMNATVVGEVAVRKIDVATARHYAEEAGEDPSSITADQIEVAVASLGLELRK